jgi:hypothetical protein
VHTKMTAVGTEHTFSYFGDQAQRDLFSSSWFRFLFDHSHPTFSLTPSRPNMVHQFC